MASLPVDLVGTTLALSAPGGEVILPRLASNASASKIPGKMIKLETFDNPANDASTPTIKMRLGVAPRRNRTNVCHKANVEKAVEAMSFDNCDAMYSMVGVKRSEERRVGKE